ncbi:DUF2059 domain-containing protein [Winogradskyella endarachnes]|uniref:DUF2059 domain-containing protein n=1 Tax=Winogradskyella endarachnes TaxID=2681965 RepID=A0A6L6U772_9FLAO|nr:DUF2059 domain-containing protein [Winogradskyella endarachnes]MUU78083.1 DUF2059 domain-containing protein [Winogradskyella endarachnes]
MRKVLTVFSFLILFSTSAFGQTDTDYAKTLRKMFEVSGTEQTFQTVIKQMFTMFKQQYAAVDAETWKELENEFSKTSLDDLTVMLVPVYEKYMTEADLKELIKFYESPVGQKFAKSTPLITQESMQIGQQWGMAIGEKFAEKMKERGY